MFVILVLSATFILSLNPSSMTEAKERRERLILYHLNRTLETAEVTPGISMLEGAAEQLVLANPKVEKEYLECRLENSFELLRPVNHGIELELSRENKKWSISQPENFTAVENMTRRSSLTVTRAGGETISVNVKIRLFKISGGENH